MGQTLDCFCKGMTFTQSHRPEEAIPNSYDKCKPGSMALFKINSRSFLSENSVSKLNMFCRGYKELEHNLLFRSNR